MKKEIMKRLKLDRWIEEGAPAFWVLACRSRVSNVVDVPNVTVSALLPEDIFSRASGR